MSEYAAREMRRALGDGPAPGEDFFRLKAGASNWVNVTPEQLDAIAKILDGDHDAPAIMNSDLTCSDLIAHEGHRLVIVRYGSTNVALECEDCSAVLADCDDDATQPREG